jgi:hypothetical protein
VTIDPFPQPPIPPVAPVRYPLGYTDEREAAQIDAERLGYRSSRQLQSQDVPRGRRGPAMTCAADTAIPPAYLRDCLDLESGLARLKAFDRAINEWLKQTFDLIDAPADPARCLHCGKAGDGALLPFGPNARGKHVWVHGECHQPWRKAREEAALAALAAYGLAPPPEWLAMKAGSEAYERFLLAWWSARPTTYEHEVSAAWAKPVLEGLKSLGFRAFVDDKGVINLKDMTGERRPPPPHEIMGIGRIGLGLKDDPGLIDSIWPPQTKVEQPVPRDFGGGRAWVSVPTSLVSRKIPTTLPQKRSRLSCRT